MSAAFDLAGHCRRAHKKFKRCREAVPYASDAIPGHLILVRPDTRLFEIDLTWSDKEEKQAKMLACSYLAQKIDAVGMILSHEMYMLDSTSAARYFGLKNDGPEDLERVTKELHAIRRERYDGQIKNMPREVRFEGVVTVMIGPSIEPQAIATQYSEGPRGEVRWLVERDAVDNPAGRSITFMLKPWWEVAKEL